MTDTPCLWLRKKRYEELNVNFRAVWDLYIKNHSVFLTFSVAAIGFAVKWIDTVSGTVTISIPLALLSLISSITSFKVAKSSQEISNDITVTARVIWQEERPIESIEQDDHILNPPGPHMLSVYAGYANCIGDIILVLFWIALPFFKYLT